MHQNNQLIFTFINRRTSTMKRLALIPAMVLTLALCFLACSDTEPINPTEPAQSDTPGLLRGSPAPNLSANPAITFIRWYTVFRQGNYTFQVPAVWVMDANGANPTMVYANYVFNGRNGQNSYNYVYDPTWSPNGQKICFNLAASGMMRDLYTMNISLVNGVPTSSNVTKICDGAASGGYYRKGVWSPTANEIAVVFAHNPDPMKIQIVPSTGGTPTTIYTCASNPDYGLNAFISYSPDGSQIAFNEVQNSTGYKWLKILDRATGLVIKTIDVSQFYVIHGIDWSRTANSSTVAFSASLSSTGPDNVYTIDVSAGSPTPVLRKSGGKHPSWSPDDSKFVFLATSWSGGVSSYNGLRTFTLSNSAITNLSTSNDQYPDWKR